MNNSTGYGKRKIASFGSRLGMARRLGWGLAAALLATTAGAGTTTAAIQSIRLVSSGNLVYVFPAGGVQGAPSCQGAGTSTYYSFSMGRPMAKEYLAALLSAHARGTSVTLIGTGTCQDEPTSETLDSLSVN